MKSIAIACPYPLDSQMGNVVTAQRISGILAELGYEPRVCHGWDGQDCDALLVLNAVKGAATAREFREVYPERPTIVLLTGTDLYRDLQNESSGGLETLANASRVIVMLEEARAALPFLTQKKTVVIPQSLEIPEIDAVTDQAVFGISVLGHLRAVKNPFHLIEVVSPHTEWDDLRVWQAGAALAEEMAGQARAWEAKDHRYQWLGELPREEGLRVLKRSRLLVNSSQLEGAPSAILEALALGVPVLASRVEGNVGLLGADFDGLFEPGNDEQLESLLMRARDEPEFLEDLRSQGEKRNELFTREREKEGWKALLAGL